MNAGSEGKKAIVTSYLEALGNQDYKAARSYMSDDNFAFRGPLASYNKPEDLLKIMLSLRAKYEVKEAFTDGDYVCVLYDLTTGEPPATVFTCGLYNVQDGKIRSIRTVFDPRPFTPTAASSNKKKLVEQHYSNVSEGRVERDREIMSTDMVHSSTVAGKVVGIDAFLGFVGGFKQAFPDLRFEILTSSEGPDTVMTEGVFVGTNTEPMMGGPSGSSMPPTGKRVELPFVDVWKFHDGRIVENHIYYDQMAFLGQLGLMPTQMQVESHA